jgi:VWFA-related protein
MAPRAQETVTFGNRPPQPPQQRPDGPLPTFVGGTDFVLVDVYPQRDGRVVPGLTQTDFQVFEDGKLQTLETFEFVGPSGPTPDQARRDPDGLRDMFQQAADPHQRVFVIYLDRLHTRIDGSNAVRSSLANALDRLIGPDDLFGVMTPDMRPRDLTLGRNTVTIADQLERNWFWGMRGDDRRDHDDPVEQALRECFHVKDVGPDGFEDWLVNDGGERRFFDELLIERRREDRVLTSLEGLVEHVGQIREARTVLLAISDGWLQFDPAPGLLSELNGDRRSTQGVPMTFNGRRTGGAEYGSFATCVAELQRLADLDNPRRFRELMTQANRANVSFYPLAATGLAGLDGGAGSQRMIWNSQAANGETPLDNQMRRMTDRVQGLKEIAENTGGIAVVNTNDTTTGLQRIVDDVSSYYLLGYRSTNERRDGRFRRIEVKVTGQGLNVRARRGYLARPLVRDAAAPGSGAPASAAVAPAAAPAAEVEIALEALGRAGSADLFVEPAVGEGKVTLVIELSSSQLSGGAWTKGGDVSVDVRTATGDRAGQATGAIAAGGRSTLLTVPLSGGAGPWRARVVATAGQTSIDEAIEIAAPVPGGLVGAPIFYRATPSPRSPVRPVADRQYRRTERVHVEWPLGEPADRRTVRVLDRRGQPLNVNAMVAEQERPGGRAVIVDVILAPLAEGEYLIELTVGGGTNETRELVAFRIVR